jgi:hypothetical protein
MPFEKGNKLGARPKPRLWEREVRKAVIQNPDKLRAAAEKLLDDAVGGMPAAIRELRETLDGKAAQRIEKTVRHHFKLKDSDAVRDKLTAALTRRQASENPTVQ